jgi:capsular polysaccharide export protein
VPGLVTIGDLDGFWANPRPPDPELRDAFVRAMAGTIQIRGVYHLEPGLSAAVDAAVQRLARGCINRPLPRGRQAATTVASHPTAVASLD